MLSLRTCLVVAALLGAGWAVALLFGPVLLTLPSSAEIQIEQITGGDSGVVVARPRVRTDVGFRVTNVSRRTFTELEFDPGCGMQIVEGQSAEEVLRVFTLERAARSPWIAAAACEPPSLAQLQLVAVAEQPDGNREFCHRTYSFVVRPPEQQTDVEGTVCFDVDESLAPAPPPVAIRLHRLPRFACFPPTIRFSPSVRQTVVSVVDRLGLVDPIVAVKHPESVSVRRLDGPEGLLEVSLLGAVPEGGDGQLVICTDDKCVESSVIVPLTFGEEP